MGWAMIVTAGGRCDIPTLRSFEMFIKFYIYLQSRRGKHPWIMDGGTEVFRNAELSTVLSFSARLEQFKKHGRVALEAAPSGNEASTMASVISFSGVESVGDPSDFRKHPQYEDFWKIVSNLPCFYDGETDDPKTISTEVMCPLIDAHKKTNGRFPQREYNYLDPMKCPPSRRSSVFQGAFLYWKKKQFIEGKLPDEDKLKLEAIGVTFRDEIRGGSFADEESFIRQLNELDKWMEANGGRLPRRSKRKSAAVEHEVSSFMSSSLSTLKTVLLSKTVGRRKERQTFMSERLYQWVTSGLLPDTYMEFFRDQGVLFGHLLLTGETCIHGQKPFEGQTYAQVEDIPTQDYYLNAAGGIVNTNSGVGEDDDAEGDNRNEVNREADENDMMDIERENANLLVEEVNDNLSHDGPAEASANEEVDEDDELRLVPGGLVMGCTCGMPHTKTEFKTAFPMQCQVCLQWSLITEKCAGFSQKDAGGREGWMCSVCFMEPEPEEVDEGGVAEGGEGDVDEGGVEEGRVGEGEERNFVYHNPCTCGKHFSHGMRDTFVLCDGKCGQWSRVSSSCCPEVCPPCPDANKEDDNEEVKWYCGLCNDWSKEGYQFASAASSVEY
ncbi:hypothetical protein THAOC_18416, partial [Thalassiosira oceanica]